MILNSCTMEGLWSLSTHYTIEEGGAWFERNNIIFGKVDFHALKFENGLIWDCINRFRNVNDDPELVQFLIHTAPGASGAGAIGLD